MFVKFPGQVFEERISMATSVTVILLHMFFLCLDLLWSAQIADHSRENRLGYLAMRLTYGVILFKAGLVFCSAFLYVYLYYILYIGMRARARVCVCVCVCGWVDVYSHEPLCRGIYSNARIRCGDALIVCVCVCVCVCMYVCVCVAGWVGVYV